MKSLRIFLEKFCEFGPWFSFDRWENIQLQSKYKQILNNNKVQQLHTIQ
jgi:hypothetical protein